MMAFGLLFLCLFLIVCVLDDQLDFGAQQGAFEVVGGVFGVVGTVLCVASIVVWAWRNMP